MLSLGATVSRYSVRISCLQAWMLEEPEDWRQEVFLPRSGWRGILQTIQLWTCHWSRPLLGLYSDTSPHPASIFQGHLSFFPLLHPYIKFVSKFSHISFFSISVAASWPRPLSRQRWSGLTCLAGLSTEAHTAARRLSKRISLQWTLVSCSLPLLSLWLPSYPLPSYVPPPLPPSSNQLPAPHSPAFQAFSTTSPVPHPPPIPTSGFN